MSTAASRAVVHAPGTVLASLGGALGRRTTWVFHVVGCAHGQHWTLSSAEHCSLIVREGLGLTGEQHRVVWS